MRSRFTESLSFLGFLNLVLFASQIVHAESSLIEEVVVTAQKREQSQQDVPISLTSFSGDAVEQLGFNDALDVVAQTPNFFWRNAGPVPLLQIRGYSLVDFGDGVEPPVGFYIDEVYRSTVAGQQGQIFDIQRVEVLRGPQGTLYGRNSNAGLVHFVSRRPTGQYEGFVNLQLGSWNQKVVDAAVSGSIGGKVRGRLSGRWNKDDGWQENLGPAGGDWAATDRLSVRGQLEFDIGDSATGLIIATYTDQDNISTGYGVEGVLDR